jgi:hypothetical protein
MKLQCVAYKIASVSTRKRGADASIFAGFAPGRPDLLEPEPNPTEAPQPVSSFVFVLRRIGGVLEDDRASSGRKAPRTSFPRRGAVSSTK